MYVPVLEKAQIKYNSKIRVANEIINYAIEEYCAPHYNRNQLEGLSIKNSVKAVNSIYSDFFSHIENGRTNIMQSLYIYIYHYIDRKYSKDSHVNKYYLTVSLPPY